MTITFYKAKEVNMEKFNPSDCRKICGTKVKFTPDGFLIDVNALNIVPDTIKEIAHCALVEGKDFNRFVTPLISVFPIKTFTLKADISKILDIICKEYNMTEINTLMAFPHDPFEGSPYDIIEFLSKHGVNPSCSDALLVSINASEYH